MTGNLTMTFVVAAAGLALTQYDLASPSIARQQLTPNLVQVQMTQEAGRDTYIHENEGTFEEWGKKVDAFNAKASQRSDEAKKAAQREIDHAWAETKTGWAKLKNASRDGWEDAKVSFESSKKKLERAWNNAQQ